MNEHNQNNQEKGNTQKLTIAGIVGLIILAIILIIVFTSNKQGEEIVESENIEEVDEVFAQPMQPFEEGEFFYSFQDIQWVIESEDEAGVGVPLTRLAWTLDEFSRRANGTLVTLFNPFDLGLIRGACEVSESTAGEVAESMGRPLSFVECVVPGELNRIEYGAFQQDNARIAILRREFNEDDHGEFVEVTAKYLNEIVR